MQHVIELQKLVGQFMMDYTNFLAVPTDANRLVLDESYKKMDLCLDKVAEMVDAFGPVVEKTQELVHA